VTDGAGGERDSMAWAPIRGAENGVYSDEEELGVIAEVMPIMPVFAWAAEASCGVIHGTVRE
jgi:hypothetical protein